MNTDMSESRSDCAYMAVIMRAVEGAVIVSMLYVTRYDVYEHSRCFLGDCTNVHSYNNHNSHPRLMTDTEKPCDAPVEEDQTVISLTVMVSSESPGDDHGQEDLTEDISPDGMESFKAMFEKGRQEVYEKACGIAKRERLGFPTGRGARNDTTSMTSNRAMDVQGNERSLPSYGSSDTVAWDDQWFTDPFTGKTEFNGSIYNLPGHRRDSLKGLSHEFISSSDPEFEARRADYTTSGSAPDIGGKVDYTEDRAAEARNAKESDKYYEYAPYSRRDRSADKTNYDRDLANEIFYRDSTRPVVPEGPYEPTPRFMPDLKTMMERR